MKLSARKDSVELHHILIKKRNSTYVIQDLKTKRALNVDEGHYI